MLPGRDLEEGIGQEEIELSDAPPNSSRGPNGLQFAQNNANNSTQQPVGMQSHIGRSLTANGRTSRPLMPAGHPRLADLMSRRPQMWIYRRFGYLNSQNLLYMQAELAGLEEELKVLQKKDAKESDEHGAPKNNNELLRARDWTELSKPTKIADVKPESTGNEENFLSQSASCCGRTRYDEWCCGERKPHEHCAQWNLALKIREKLQRYNEALIQQMSLASAEAPDAYDLEYIQSSFDLDDQYRGMKNALLGNDKLLYLDGGEHAEDLVALAPPSKRAPFTEWVSKKLVKRILDRKSCWSKIFRGRMLKEKSLIRWTTAATSAVTATVPIISVVVLYFTPNTNMRLALLAVFNLLAAYVLYIFTEAHPMQVFAASAAYSAVNIVFISSNATASS